MLHRHRFRVKATKLSRHQFLHLAAGAAALPAVSRIASAQTYPTQPVRIIVGFAAGGATDIIARLTGQWLSERLGQPFVIENRPGAGSNLATEAVVRAPADGYTLLLANATNATNATLYDKLNFNFVRDIAPVAGIMREPLCMVVHPSFPAKTVPEFIAYAKANPARINMASSGYGAFDHVSGELFKMMGGVNMIHVPYRGGAPAIIDLLGGQVQVYFSGVAGTIEYNQGRQTARAGGDRGDALGGAAGRADGERFSAGLRGNLLVGRRRAQEHARRDCRQAQQRDQRGPRRPQVEGASRRFGHRGACVFARPIRQAHRRRYGEVGQGDPSGPYQGGIGRGVGIGSKAVAHFCDRHGGTCFNTGHQGRQLLIFAV